MVGLLWMFSSVLFWTVALVLASEGQYEHALVVALIAVPNAILAVGNWIADAIRESKDV